MTKIIYASETGTTEDIAELIRKELPADTEMVDASMATQEDFTEPDFLLLGTSTWGEGDLPSDWEGALPLLEEIDFSGKKVALFGLGDQDGYGECFVDAMGILYEVLTKGGAACVGFTSTAGYDHEASRAEIEAGTFCGLVLDEDNQDHLTQERISAWIATIKDYVK